MWLAVARMAVLLSAAALAACSSGSSGASGSSGGVSFNPVDWWHSLEGGRIADTRPPPPNADAPYPNLNTVPAKPAAPDAAAHTRIADALVADRGNATYTQRTSPIGVVPAPNTPEAGVRPPPLPPQTADADQPNAALPAATAHPPPPSQTPPPEAPVVPHKAPLAPVSAAPLDAPPKPADTAAPAQPEASAAPAPAPAATPAEATAAAPAPAAPPAAAPAAAAASPATPAPAPAPPGQVADAAMPAVPDAPPPPPVLAGVATPPAVTAPTPPVLAPPPPPAVPKPNGPPVPIPFATGSAVLQPEALPAIKLLANQRGGATIAVTGYGEAASTAPDAQAAALPLALDRARAVAARLMAVGVPGSAIRIAADPQGSGAAARLVN